MTQTAPPPPADDAQDSGVAFVLRCRRENPGAGRGPGRLHFRLQQVGEEQSLRFTDLDRVFETLRGEIARLLGDDGANETKN